MAHGNYRLTERDVECGVEIEVDNCYLYLPAFSFLSPRYARHVTSSKAPPGRPGL